MRKRFFLLLILLTICLMSTAWTAETAGTESAIPEAINFFIKGLNNHSYITAKPYISKDFEIEGVPSEYMKQALEQVFGSFPLKIEQYQYKSDRQGTRGRIYTITIMADYQTSDIEFELDKAGKVVTCSMFATLQPDNMNATDLTTIPDYAELDFELVNDIIIVPVELNGENVKFILDSGAPMLVLNSVADSVAGALIVSAAQGIGGSIENSGFVHVKSFSWAGGSNKSFDTVSMDLSHLEAEVGMKFHGLISKAELEPFETYIDYNEKKIRLYKLKDNGDLIESAGLEKAKSEMKFSLNSHIACLKASIGKKKVTMGLDTGAQTNLLDDDFYKTFEKLLQDVQTDTLRGADTNRAIIETGVIPITKVGKLSFPDMRYAFSDISVLNNAYNLDIDGILGYPFLSKHPVSINYRKQVIRFYE